MHLIRASLNAGTTANSTGRLPFDLQLRSDIHLHLTCICIPPSQTLLDFLTQTTVSVTVFMVLFNFLELYNFKQLNVKQITLYFYRLLLKVLVFLPANTSYVYLHSQLAEIPFLYLQNHSNHPTSDNTYYLLFRAFHIVPPIRQHTNKPIAIQKKYFFLLLLHSLSISHLTHLLTN